MSWTRIGAIIQKSWYNSQRDVFRLFDIFFWPAFSLFVWGLFAGYLSQTAVGGVNILFLLLGAVILWTFFDRASKDISLAMIDELWNRNFVSLFSTPLTVGEYLVGVTVVAAIKLIISMVLMLFLASMLYGFQITSLGLYWIPAAVGLTIFGWSLSLLVQACIIRFGHTVEVFIWAIAVMIQPLSCVFYPLTALPAWAQTLALGLPSTYLFENMRTTMAGGAVRLDQLVISFSLNILYFLLSLLFFYRSFDSAKVKGNLIKNY